MIIKVLRQILPAHRIPGTIVLSANGASYGILLKHTAIAAIVDRYGAQRESDPKSTSSLTRSSHEDGCGRFGIGGRAVLRSIFPM